MMRARFHLSNTLRKACAWFFLSGSMRSGMAAGIVLWCLGNYLALPLVFAQKQGNDLATASLEQLTQMQISVSSFSRKDEDLWKTPAPVFVITREDIARSAVSSIPELLRTVPGVQVAQVNSAAWAVSVRGFNTQLSNKVLVLVDGRTVYSEIYSGTQWDEIDLPLEDIERIEIVRGPGAAVWGTDAANGVINILTKKARCTMGFKASDHLSRIGDTADISYGGTLGQRAQYRVFASYVNRQPFDTLSGGHAFDGENTMRGGGRLDWQPGSSDLITTTGDLFKGKLKQQILQTIAVPVGPNGDEHQSIAGGYLLSRWEHKFSNAETALQIFYDSHSEHKFGADIRTSTLDIDFQDHSHAGTRNDLVWGSEYRFTADKVSNEIEVLSSKPNFTNYLADAFMQDEITLAPNRLFATLGSKIQYGTLARFQLQPSARLLWAPSPTQALWAAVSRAAVAPSIQDTGFAIPGVNLGTDPANGLSLIGTLRGNPRFKPETVAAYEIGYRKMLNSALTLDVASFLNNNIRIQTLTVGTPTFVSTATPHLTTDLLYTNGFRARTGGVEATLAWKPRNSLLLQSGFTWMEAHTKQTVSGNVVLVDTWSTPRSSFTGSASWNFSPRWDLSSAYFYVGNLPRITTLSITPVSVTGPPAYNRLDLNLARKIGNSTKFELSGTNLLTPRHQEFGNGRNFVTSAYVPRSFSVKATWSF